MTSDQRQPDESFTQWWWRNFKQGYEQGRDQARAAKIQRDEAKEKK